MVERHAARGWLRYLEVVTVAVIAFGVVLIAAPGVTEAAFGWMIFGTGGFPDSFPAAATDYGRLVHAVLGATIVGWFSLVLWVVHGPLAAALPGSWIAVALSLTLWFIPDSLFSVVSGHWQNAVLNTVIVAAYVPGMVATRSLRTLRTRPA